MSERLKKIFPQFVSSILNSYSQVFFSDSRIFAVFLMAVSFFDLYAGIAGLLAVTVSNTSAYLIGFNRYNIKSGFYGFNSLLVGLGLGIFFQPGLEFYMVLVFAAALTLFITVSLEGFFGKYGLPYLSISFLLGIWMTSLATRQFSALDISERGIYMSNEIFTLGGYFFLGFYNRISNLSLHESVVIYFRSLGAIFFQYHLFAGFIVALGLLIYSRIAFLLSLIGFFGAYLFYRMVGGNFLELSHSYIGFNFILTSIAIGGFFIVPSRFSFLWVFLLIPLISITITSSIELLGLFQLSIYSLPFNLIVILFLYILKFRERYYNKPELVYYQQFSPEKNLYAHISNKIRFEGNRFLPVSLPFWGEWTVTQGHQGQYTHKNEWSEAWDFEIMDEAGKPFRGKGTKPSDYFCYNKPVIAPADGWIETIYDGVDDNEIGEVNLKQNWGNSVIIRHHDTLFSQLSHLKKESFKVKRGDYVKKGDIIAYSGNSGRSPAPHLHFQFQETLYIGSKTLRYPFGYYILNENNRFDLQSFSIPQEKQVVSNIKKNNSLTTAFRFVPGRVLKFRIKDNITGKEQAALWEIRADIYNNTYIYCEASKSFAYFKNDGFIHAFTHFTGPKNSLLYYFYMAAFKLTLGTYEGLVVEDVYPLNVFYNRMIMTIQDFAAPFYIFLRPGFRLEHVSGTGEFSEDIIIFKSYAFTGNPKDVKHKINFELKIESNKIKEIKVRGNRTDFDFYSET
ncbi:MAG: urea transporter [Bacteroidales bacterium]|nr:urea transporter [Bacteroidales bacterium]